MGNDIKMHCYWACSCSDFIRISITLYMPLYINIAVFNCPVLNGNEYSFFSYLVT